MGIIFCGWSLGPFSIGTWSKSFSKMFKATEKKNDSISVYGLGLLSVCREQADGPLMLTVLFIYVWQLSKSMLEGSLCVSVGITCCCVRCMCAEVPLCLAGEDAFVGRALIILPSIKSTSGREAVVLGVLWSVLVCVSTWSGLGSVCLNCDVLSYRKVCITFAITSIGRIKGLLCWNMPSSKHPQNLDFYS